MTDDYDSSYGYGYGETVDDAIDAGDNPHACPPNLKRYRIYPEADFGDLFSDPPDNVDT